MQMASCVEKALAFLQCGAAEVRKAAAEAVVVLLRHCPDEAQRTHIYNVLMGTHAAGAFFSDRMVFLDVCTHILECFSHRYVLTV